MAVEVLFRLKDGAGGRKKGDIVTVKPYPNDGWGNKEGPPNYGKIIIEGRTMEDFKTYHKRHNPVILDVEGNSTTMKRSDYQVDYDKLKLQDKTAMLLGSRPLLSSIKGMALVKEHLSVITDTIDTRVEK